jgi:uncharacterized protein (TIGR04255 family)
MSSEIVYPHQPLVEAVFEIQFPANPAIECHRDDFYEMVKSEYSEINVPKVKDGEAPALAFYSFEKPDKTACILIKLNTLVFSIKKYTGYNEFRSEVLKVFTPFVKHFKINKIKKTGLRYVNIIKFIRDGQILPLTEYLNINLGTPLPLDSNKLGALDLVLGTVIGEGGITTKIQSINAKDGSHEAFLLDFDFIKVGTDLSSDKIKDYIDESHGVTKAVFESLITDGYRKYITIKEEKE